VGEVGRHLVLGKGGCPVSRSFGEQGAQVFRTFPASAVPGGDRRGRLGFAVGQL